MAITWACRSTNDPASLVLRCISKFPIISATYRRIYTAPLYYRWKTGHGILFLSLFSNTMVLCNPPTYDSNPLLPSLFVARIYRFLNRYLVDIYIYIFCSRVQIVNLPIIKRLVVSSE